MARVDPYVVDVPRTISQQGGQPSKEMFDWFTYTHRFLHDLAIRTGGGTDLIEKTTTLIESADNQIAQLFGLIQEAKNREFRAVTVTSDYTAAEYDFINATSNCTITFPSNPGENSVIIVRKGGGNRVGLVGNGRNINGSSTGTLTQNGTAIHFHYFIDTNEWFAR